jgi:transcriptional regulator with XRE-family HTH domain
MNDADRLRISKNIRALRLQHAYKQSDIADRFFINRSRYSQIETGKVEIPLGLLLDLARHYGVPLDEITSSDINIP